MAKVILTRIDSVKGNKVNLSKGEVSIGRGSILECDDKRISRNHGLLHVSDDGSVTLVSMHSNPCFYKLQAMDQYAVLVKGQSKVLNPGDEFSLLPDAFRYRVDSAQSVPDSIPPCGVENGAASKRKRKLPNWLTGLSTGGADLIVPSAPRKRKVAKGAGIEEDKTATKQDLNVPSTSSEMRKASTEGSPEEVEAAEVVVKQEPPTSGNEQQSTSSAVEETVETQVKQEASGSILPSTSVEDTGETRVKQEVSGPPEENGGGTQVKEEPPVTISPSPSPPQPNGTKDGYEAEYGGAAGSSNQREPCPYGVACYRKNPGHRAELSHPGDADYPVVPECPYGAACYRRNPQHRRDYSHSGPPATPPPATPPATPTTGTRRKRTTKDDDASEDDYDCDDPFLNDASSDDYQPTSSEDSDSDQDEDEDQESQERRRMLKEAKKFTKKKKK